MKRLLSALAVGFALVTVPALASGFSFNSSGSSSAFNTGSSGVFALGFAAATAQNVNTTQAAGQGVSQGNVIGVSTPFGGLAFGVGSAGGQAQSVSSSGSSTNAISAGAGIAASGASGSTGGSAIGAGSITTVP